MSYTKEQRVVNSSKVKSPIAPTSLGSMGDSPLIVPNHSGDHSRGRVYATPTTDYEIANKKYVDDTLAGAGGADVKVAVDSGATAGFLGAASSDGVLRTDATLTYSDGGDFVTIGVANEFTEADETKLDGIETGADVTDATNVAAAGALMDSGTDIIDDTHINWGTGAGQVSAVDIPIADSGAIITATDVEAALQEIKTAVDLNTTHAADNTQAHSDYLLNSGADVAVGPITITADNSTADQAYVPMVLYNTDATPPAASGFPIGTIYIQYTA